MMISAKSVDGLPKRSVILGIGKAEYLMAMGWWIAWHLWIYEPKTPGTDLSCVQL